MGQRGKRKKLELLPTLVNYEDYAKLTKNRYLIQQSIILLPVDRALTKNTELLYTGHASWFSMDICCQALLFVLATRIFTHGHALLGFVQFHSLLRKLQGYGAVEIQL